MTRSIIMKEDDPTKLQSSNFKGIRDIILDKKRRTDPEDFVVVLKPTQDAPIRTP